MVACSSSIPFCSADCRLARSVISTGLILSMTALLLLLRVVFEGRAGFDPAHRGGLVVGHLRLVAPGSGRRRAPGLHRLVGRYRWPGLERYCPGDHLLHPFPQDGAPPG